MTESKDVTIMKKRIEAIIKDQVQNRTIRKRPFDKNKIDKSALHTTKILKGEKG